MQFKHFSTLKVRRGFQFNGKEYRPGDVINNLDIPARIFNRLLQKDSLESIENSNAIPMAKVLYIVDPDDICEQIFGKGGDEPEEIISVFTGYSEEHSSLITVSPTEFPELISDEDITFPEPRTSFGKELLSETQGAAESFCGEFVSILQSHLSREITGQRDGEFLDDLVATRTTGECWGREETIDFSGFDVSICLDMSGSVFDTRDKLFTRICQAGYFIYSMTQEAKRRKFPMSCQILLFATQVCLLPQKLHPCISGGLDWEGKVMTYANGAKGTHIQDPLKRILRKLGGSTSLFSAASQGLRGFHPRNKGLFFLLTDVTAHSSYSDKLNSLEIPDGVTPIYINLSRGNSAVIGKTVKWNFLDINNPELDLMGSLMEAFRDKITDMVSE